MKFSPLLLVIMEEEQQFYLTDKYDNIPDKEFTLNKMYDDLDISHVHSQT